MTKDEWEQRLVTLEQEIAHSKKRKRKLYFALALVVLMLLLIAATITKPYTFSQGQTISSSQVNSNFDALYSLVNGNIDSSNLSSDAGSLVKVSGGLITASGSNIGIGTTAPASKLDVAGTVSMTGLMLSGTPSSGYVLTSDSRGNGTWQTLPSSAKGFAGVAQTKIIDSGWFSSSFVTIASVTVNVQAGQSVLITYCVECASSPGGSSIRLRLPVGYDWYAYCAVNGESYPASYQYLDITPGAGTHTYTLQACNTTGGVNGKIVYGYLTAISG